jgi:hypothetical protein
MRGTTRLVAWTLTLVLLGTAAVQAQTLVGMWRSNIPMPLGSGFSEVILMPNGSFSKTFRYGQVFTRDVGTYTVGQGFVHFTILDHEPKWYMGTRMSWPTSETWYFQFTGPDTVIFYDRITNTRWIATRAGY